MRVHRRFPAMATVFELWLDGDDEEHLSAVADSAVDEVHRIERLLSRFDPAAEVYRINAEASRKPVLVDFEMLALLLDCRERFEQTEGYFSVCMPPSGAGAWPLTLDEPARTVRITRPDVHLDLGGYGKGYALDSAAKLIREHGVSAGFLHGGTSSALALGGSWRVGIRGPFEDADTELSQVEMTNGGLSSSATISDEQTASDVIDPVTGVPIREPAGCTVLAPTALDAEVLSTALLAMGKSASIGYLRRRGNDLPCSVLWLEREGDKPNVDWLKGNPDERNQ